MTTPSLPIQIDSTANGNLVSGQRLNYSFSLLFRQDLRIFLDGQGLADAFLRIYDSNNNLIIANDDDGNNGDSLIIFAFQPGSYRIEVAGYNDRFGGTFALALSSRSQPANTFSSQLETNSGATPAVSSGSTTKDNTVVLTGTLVPGSTIQIFDGTTLLDSSGAANSRIQIQGNNWRYVTSALADGVHNLKAQIAKLGSDTFEQVIELTVDTQVSGTFSPTIRTNAGSSTAITAGGSTTDRTLDLSGTVDGGSTVQIFDGSRSLGFAIVTNNAWSFTTPPLSVGSRSLSAVFKDAAGNSTTSGIVAVTIETPPDGSVIQIGETITDVLTLGSRTSYVLNLEFEQLLKMSLDGQSLNDAFLRVYRKNANSPLDLVAFNDDAGGNADSLISQLFPAGKYIIEAAAYQDRGAGTYALKIENLSPQVNGLSQTVVTNGGLTPTIQNNQTTKDNTLLLQGTLAPSAVVEIFDGITSLGRSDRPNASWKIQGSNWNFQTSALADGPHNLKAVFTASGSAPENKFFAVTVDSVLTGTLEPAALTNTGSTSSIGDGGTTTDSTLELNGTIEFGNRVQVFDGLTLLGNATVTQGNWSFTTPALSIGSHNLVARALDAVGNAWESNTLAVTIAQATSPGNSVAVGQTIRDTLALNQRIKYELNLVQAENLRVFLDGESLPDAYLRIYDSTNTVIAFSDDAPGFGLDSLVTRTFALGRYQIEAGSYNDRYAGSFSLSVTSLAPPANSVSPTLLTDSGKVPNIQFGGQTKDNTVGLSGKVGAGTVVNIFNGNTQLSSSTEGAGGGWVLSGTDWSFTTQPILTNGLKSFSVRFNSPSSTTPVLQVPVSFTLDTVANGTVSPTIDTNTGANPSIQSGSSTSDTTLGLSGTAEAGSTVRIFQDTTELGSGVLVGSSWSFTTPALGLGPRPLRVQFEDAVGNTSESSLNVTITGSNVAPVVSGTPTVKTFTEPSGSAPSQANAVVINSTVAVTDADGPSQIGSARVRITNVQSGDELLFVNTPKISGVYASGLLTLSAVAEQTPTNEEFTAALQSVRFNNTSNTPNTTARSITFAATDKNTAISNLLTETVNVVANTTDSFDITLNFAGSDAYKSYFEDAAARWSLLITDDLPNANTAITGTVDDLLIVVTVADLDGPGGQLGEAEAEEFRNLGAKLPFKSSMKFDLADIPNLIEKGTFANIVFHEMGHALGFGNSTLNESSGVLDAADSLKFTGVNALREYRLLQGDPALQFVPLEDTGDPKTRGDHWIESIFGSELMTGFVRGAVSQPLSKVTLGALEDYGYKVNYAQADADFRLVTVMSPGFLNPTATTTVQENLSQTTLAYQATATGARIEGYGLGGDDADLFSVNAQGQVFFRASPNFENPLDANRDNIYSFNLIAQGVNNVRSIQAVTLTVSDFAAPTSSEAYLKWKEAEESAANVPSKDLQALNKFSSEIVQARSATSADGSANQTDANKRLTQWVNQVTGTDVVSEAEFENGFVITGKAAAGAQTSLKFRLDNDRTTGADGAGAQVFGVEGLRDQVTVDYNNATGDWQLTFAESSTLLRQAVSGVSGSGVHQLVVDTDGNASQNGAEAGRLFLVASGTAVSGSATNFSVQDRLTKDVFVYYFGDPDGNGVGMNTSLDRRASDGSIDTAVDDRIAILNRDGSPGGGDVDYYSSSTAFNSLAAVTADNTALRFVTNMASQTWEFHMGRKEESGTFAQGDGKAADHSLWGSNTSRLVSLQELVALYAANFQANGTVGPVEPISNRSSTQSPNGENNQPSGWSVFYFSAAPTPSGHAMIELNEGVLADTRISLSSAGTAAVL